VIEVQGNEKLIRPMKDNSDIIFYVHDEELYDILLNIHLSIGHSGRDGMMYELKKIYKNITHYSVYVCVSVVSVNLDYFYFPKPYNSHRCYNRPRKVIILFIFY